jgi:hypothetical protein
MPWTASDAKRFTKSANSPSSEDQWSKVANSVLSKTGDESQAIKAASGVVKKRKYSPQKNTLSKGVVK